MTTNRKMYLGVSKFMIPIPRTVAAIGMDKSVSGARAVAARLTVKERRVHHFIVRKMATATEPLTVEIIAQGLDLPVPRVAQIVDKLERLKTFVFREGGDGIDWAYPLSVTDTGHEMEAPTGERFFAA